MSIVSKKIVVIGGGPAGLAAAIGAKENGVDDILILERGNCLGGILTQCIHAGFGLHSFKEELSGPEYAARYIEKIKEYNIEYYLDTMVISVTENKLITAVSPKYGLIEIQAEAIILAMGCRERTRGALNIAGSRPAGVYTAGTAQYYVNLAGKMVGKKVVILGSGDIGLIMARRLTLEGAEVLMVLELMPYSNGLGRNIAQCLEDFNIPLKLSHTVVGISGKNRVEGITIAKVDENRIPIKETFEFIECDTLLLSVGLIPENELTAGANVKLDPITNGSYVDETLQTSVEGIFACGNVLHVHDVVDYVSAEAYRAGVNAAKLCLGSKTSLAKKKIKVDGGIRYCVPQQIGDFTNIPLMFRVGSPVNNKTIAVIADGEVVYKRKEAFLTPSEMQQVNVNNDIAQKLNVAKEVCLTLL